MDTEMHSDNAARTSSGMLVALILLTAGTSAGWGAFSWEGLALVTAAAALCAALHLGRAPRGVPAEALLTGIAIAFAAATAMLATGAMQTRVEISVPGPFGAPVRFRRLDGFGLAIRLLGAGALGGMLAWLSCTATRGRRWIFIALVVFAVATRVLMPFSTPQPAVDVFVSQTGGASQLLKGGNVYAMEFSSPYRPGITFDHYAYPPLTLYANFLSWHLFKDVRGMWIMADLLGALCLYLVARRMNPAPERRRFAELAALAFLFFPRSLFVIEQSWTEPLCVATTGLFALALARRSGPMDSGVLMGLWFSSKQYIALAVPLVLKLRRVPALGWAVAVALGVTLMAPMALWDFDALYHDLFGFFLTSQSRPDALSLAGALARFGWEMPWWVTAPLWIGAAAFFTWRMPRTLAGMLFGTASLWLVFFLLGKQAFMNYFYLIAYVLLLAVAATPQDTVTLATTEGRGERIPLINTDEGMMNTDTD